MSHTDQTQVRIIVNDEQSLYSAFSPEAEFNEPVKAYIRSKIANKSSDKGIRMAVISKKSLDEDKFRSAVANWIKSEKTVFSMEEKNTVRRLIGLLVFGSIMIMLCLSIQKSIDVLQYSLMPIMGSLALSRAASILILDMPEIRAKRWIFKKIEENSVIEFEYGNDTNNSACDEEKDRPA